MAFNPFHSFRKHQKVIFAALTILCMLTFVLAGSLSGGGDFFSEITRIVQGRSRAEVRIYGKDYTPRDMVMLKQRRIMANQLMSLAVTAAQQNVAAELMNEKKHPEAAQQMRQAVQMSELFRQIGRAEEANRYVVGQLAQLHQRLFFAKKEDDAKLVGDYLEAHQHLAAMGRNNLYFGGTTSQQDMIDFVIWLHQADRLGIKIDPDKDVPAEFERETFKRISNREAVMLRDSVLSGYSNVAKKDLLSALADEFRVRLAKIALGYERGYRSSPGTPWDYWEYFRDKRYENTVAVLPIPVRDASGKLEQDWVKDIKSPPSKQELEDLFNKYKNQEYDPHGRQPGFKQPRRVQVAWVEANADSKYYRQEAARTMALVEGLFPGAYTPRLLVEYDRLQKSSPTWNAPDRSDYRLHDASCLTPRCLTALLGQALTSAGTGAAAPSVGGLYLNLALRADTATRVRIGMPRVLASTVPGVGALMQAATELAPTPKLPVDVYRPVIVQTIQAELAREFVNGTLNRLKADVQKQKKLPADAVKNYDLKEGATKEPLDRFALADAKGLEPFRDAYRKVNLFKPENAAPSNDNFAKLFLDLKAPFEPAVWPRPGFPEEKPPETAFLYWITEDKPAYVPQSMEAVRPQVESAWRLLEARKRAEKEGDALAKSAAESGADALRSLKQGTAHSKKDGVFILGGSDRDQPGVNHVEPAVARLTKMNMALPERPGMGLRYTPYSLPAGMIPYSDQAAAQAIVNKLLALKKKGETTTFWDEKENTFYVATLLEQIPAKVDEFYQFYKDPLEADPNAVSQFQRERRVAFQNALMQRLRDDAGYWLNPEFDRTNQTNTED